MRNGISQRLLKLIAIYFSNSDKKLNILIKNKDFVGQKKKWNFIENILNLIVDFLKLVWIKKEKSTNILDKFENIIFTDSTLGYEAISRKKSCYFSSKQQQNK